MKKLLYMTLALVLTAVSAWAGPVDEATARSNARHFLERQSSSGMLRYVPSTEDMQLVYTEMSNVVINQAAYYIYNTSNSFLVVSGNSLVRDILIYGDSPLDWNDIPCGLQYLLDLYKAGIDGMFSHTDVMLSKPNNFTTGMETSVEPLLSSLWDQREPYNNYCPEYNGEKCLTGCACTSLSMVFHYWKYSNITTNLTGYTTAGLGIFLNELEPTEFDWDNMLDVYEEGNYTEEEGNAVALLMRYVGQAEYMSYSPEGSGAYDFNIANAVRKFGYNENVACLSKQNYVGAQWKAMMLAELEAARPIVYVGYDINSGVGHAFNVDGYDGEENLYHINFGWGGKGNAYCALDDFSGESYTFSNRQSMIIGIRPPGDAQPTLTVSPSTLSFNTQVGNTVTKAISIRANDLEGDLTLELSDINGNYSVSRTTIPADEALAGTTVEVSYHPTSTGMSTASVLVSGDGLAPKVVKLTGTATLPVITVTPSVLDMNTGVGEAVTATFTVRGSSLSGGLTLSLEDAGGCFTINKSSLDIASASAGATVTVTYNPVAAGVHNASVTVSSEGAESQTLILNGTAVAPEPPGEPSITTSVSSLEFGNCYNGYNEFRSLTLTGVHLTENISLSLIGTNCEDFAITSSSTITPEEAAQGVNVTVKCFPCFQGGFRNLYLVISCPDVPEIKIPINGNAIKTGAFIYPDKKTMSFATTVGEPVTMQLGVVLREFDGWLATPSIDFDPDFPDLPLIDLLPIICDIDGDECFTVFPGRLFNASTGNDSIVFIIEYYPDEVGTHHAQLTLNTVRINHPAHPVTVELVGVAGALIPGDMNYDGVLTEEDIALLGQALTDYDGNSVLTPAADVNGDGVVNLKDLIDLIDLVREND